jgi:hypothetical protein
VSRTVFPIPPAIAAEMAKGFTLYKVKAVSTVAPTTWLISPYVGLTDDNRMKPSALSSENTFFDNKESRP